MPQWFDAGAEADIRARGRRMVKAHGKQILVLVAGERVVACNNRCPHEGYPLSEGTLGDGCTLTCNWHNWKFDLVSGETLVGGDRLRLYPVALRDGRVFVDVAEAPPGETQARALANLLEAVEDDDQGRIARDLARFLKAGGDPMAAMAAVVVARADRHEYGMGHGFAAMPDWIALHRSAPDAGRGLVALVEPLVHVGRDTLREPHFPFTTACASWNAEAFLHAMEQEDEARAGALVRGALADGVALAELRRAFARAALAHYQDYGHSAIYTVKAFALVDLLGPTAAAPVLLSLVRSVIMAAREDRIPAFRSYGPALARWQPDRPAQGTAAADLLHQPVPATLERVLTLGGDPEAQYRTLLAASAMALLRFDLSVDLHVDKPVSHNVGWLDFTHMLTFGNAVRALCTDDPALWPQALLQMGCFLGRVAPFMQREDDPACGVPDIDAFLAVQRERLHDHGLREPILACHRVKTTFAVAEEIAWAAPGPLAELLAAALNRYLNAPFKQHHGLRLATQALAFVDAEG